MIKSLLTDDEPEQPHDAKVASSSRTGEGFLNLFDQMEAENNPQKASERTPESYEPETMAETVRMSGLAWSAGIAFFAAVVFMLVLGWGADVLLGTSPWGIVGGIVLGSVIGFIQFFRITSQIFRK